MVILTTVSIILTFAQNLWIETSQQDFADGIFEKNLFASHFNGGAVEFVPRWDLNNDGYIDLFTADAHGPYARIFWGSASGFNTVTLFPVTGSANCDAADLNRDGYVDFVVAHNLTPKISIYWGTPTGPTPTFYFDIPTAVSGRQGVFIADLDKDGYLDIITSQEYIAGNSAIFWGDSLDYNPNRRTDLPSYFGVHNIEVADFNWDSWLDILITQYLDANNKIYWGSAAGYSPANYTLLPGPDSHGASVADLNRDRLLDLVFTAWNGSDSYIYWGSRTGYSISNMDTLLPGSCYGGSAIADLNNDSYLDILFHRTGGQQVIYWGRTSGYSNSDKTYIGTSVTATGGLIADLNYDGNLDIFTDNMESFSPIFWGPNFVTSTNLVVNDDHHAMFREIGNVYDRSYKEFYLSSIFDASDTVNWGMVTWDDSLPTGASIDMMVRTGNTSPNDSTWSLWFITNNGDSIPDTLNSQFIQYMALLKYTNPAYLPMLNEVQIAYEFISAVSENESRFDDRLQITPTIINDHAKIMYCIEKPSLAKLAIYSINGQQIVDLVNKRQLPGTYSITWDGCDTNGKRVPAGRYYLILSSDDQTKFDQLIQIK